MPVQTADGWDCIHANIAHAPKTGQPGGYLTGSSMIVWTAADIAAHPGVVLYDQSPTVTDLDTTADMLDMEQGAAGLEDIVPFITKARAHFNAATRPGQRWPGVYCSRSNVTSACNTMAAAGLTGVPLAIAHYTFDRAGAQSEVANSGGPFPVVIRQYSDKGGGGTYDLSVYSVPWLQNVSKKVSPTPTPPKPPASYKVTTPPSLTTKAGTPTAAFGLGPNGEKLWVTYTLDGKTWSDPVSIG